MLDEAGLLQPEAVAAWRNVSLEEARGAAGLARTRAEKSEETHPATGEESPRRRRPTA